MAKKDSTASIKKAAAVVNANSNSNSNNPSGSHNHSNKAIISSNNSIFQSVNDFFSAIQTTYQDYLKTLTPRLKLIDLFLTFLVLLGILQFTYVLIIGNFPFNAFLGGFISCVGQFVLTVNLRLQYNANNNGLQLYDEYKLKIINKDISEINKGNNKNSNNKETKNASVDDDVDIDSLTDDVSNSIFKKISPERSFGDFIFASLILHFIVIHFIN